MFKHIVVPMDGSALAECVLPHVVALARMQEAHVTLLHVLEPPRLSGGQSISVDPLEWHISKAESRAYLEDLKQYLQQAGVGAETVIMEGQAAESIVQFARHADTDLIVLSSHGQSGLSSWNISSVVQKILLRANRSTLLVRAYQPVSPDLDALQYRRVLVPLDCSRRAESALPAATILARQFDTQILLAHVVQQPEMPRRTLPTQQDRELAELLVERNRREAGAYLTQVVHQLAAQSKIRLVVGENVAGTLHALEEAEAMDLVVLSAHGYSGNSRWPFGSIATSFILYGSAPLLIVQDFPPEELVPMQAEEASRERPGRPPILVAKE